MGTDTLAEKAGEERDLMARVLSETSWGRRDLQLRTVRLRRNFRDPGQTPQFDREGKWKDKDLGSIYSPQTGEP